MTAESRQHPRYAVALSAELTLGVETVEAATENISAGGVAVALDAALSQGRQVDLTLILTQDGIEDPFEEPFEIRAVVAWGRPRDGGGHVVGLRFEGLTPAQQQRLAAFIVRLDESA